MNELQANDPKSLGQYTLLNRLGSGGFGIVYLAAASTGQQVAIKVLRSELADDERLRTRLAREARAISAVAGNRTAKVYEVVTDGPFAYLVMEYVPGESLDTLVSQNRKPEGPLLWFSALGLVEALQEIHSAGITHRDLKPSNVIVGPDGVKVVDFGISAITDEAGFTQTGTLMGSAAWLSPEQVTGATADQRTDIFNLGLCLAFLATGRHPFGQGRPDAVMFRITAQAPDLDSVPNPLRIAVQKCLQRNPADRPSLESLARFFASGGSESAEMSLGSLSQSESTFVVQPSAVSIAAKAASATPSQSSKLHPQAEQRKSNTRALAVSIVAITTLGTLAVLDSTNVVDLGVVVESSDSNPLPETTPAIESTTSVTPTTVSVARTTTTTEPPPPAFKLYEDDRGRRFRWNPCQAPIEVFLNPGTFLNDARLSSLGRFIAQTSADITEMTGLPVVYSGVTEKKVSNSYRGGEEIIIQIAPPKTGIMKDGNFLLANFFSYDRVKKGVGEIDSFNIQWNSIFISEKFTGADLNANGQWLVMHSLANAMGLDALNDADMTGFGINSRQRKREVMFWSPSRGNEKPTWGAGDKFAMFLVGSSNECF